MGEDKKMDEDDQGDKTLDVISVKRHVDSLAGGDVACSLSGKKTLDVVPLDSLAGGDAAKDKKTFDVVTVAHHVDTLAGGDAAQDKKAFDVHCHCGSSCRFTGWR